MEFEGRGSAGKGFRTPGNQIKGAVGHFLSIFVCVLGGGVLSSGHNGSDPILRARSPPGSNCWWAPGVKVGCTFGSWKNSFVHALTTQPIN